MNNPNNPNQPQFQFPQPVAQHQPQPQFPYPQQPQPQNMPGMFAGIGGANVSDSKPKLTPGFDGDVCIAMTKLYNSQQYGLCWIVEFDIVTSNHPSHPEGKRHGWLRYMSNQLVAMSSIKEWAAAVKGVDHNDPTFCANLEGELSQAMADPDNANGTNPFVGRNVHVVADSRIGKNSGRPYVKLSWSPATGMAGAPVASAPVPQAAPPQAQPQYQAPPQAASMYQAPPQAPQGPMMGAQPVQPPAPPQAPPQAPQAAPPGWQPDGKGGWIPTQ